jgi:O-antigen ligase
MPPVLSRYLQNALLFLLTLTLILFFSNFAFQFANYKTLFYYSLIFTLPLCALNPLPFGEVVRRPETARFLTGIILLLALGILPINDMAPIKSSLQHIAYFGVLVLLILQVAHRLHASITAKFLPLIAVIIGTAIVWHLYGQIAINPLQSSFQNPHTLAQLCLFALPVFALTAWRSRSWTLRTLLLAVAIAANWLLINSQSRPAWIALVAGLGIVVVLGTTGRTRWLALGGIAASVAVAYLLFPQLVADRMNDLLLHITTEERVAIWQTGWQMQLQGSPLHWLIGFGPGSYQVHFPDMEIIGHTFYFPHNFVLEVLFESGIIGLTVVGLFYVWFAGLLLHLLRASPSLQPTLLTLIYLFVSQLLFCFLVQPFYSRNSLLLQAPVVALTLHLYRLLRPETDSTR